MFKKLFHLTFFCFNRCKMFFFFFVSVHAILHVFPFLKQANVGSDPIGIDCKTLDPLQFIVLHLCQPGINETRLNTSSLYWLIHLYFLLTITIWVSLFIHVSFLCQWSPFGLLPLPLIRYPHIKFNI